MRQTTCLKKIAQRLGHHKSTISRELKRNAFPELYSSSVVQGAYYACRKVFHPGGSSATKRLPSSVFPSR
ncbi:helix-turn-helix domain-containing protein [Pyramidobacter sp.]|uniref:helix-turn-helix domain-containing protein n=1 Tax=Pyramidobacter sp. TaxID=1943581 RepID=UPI0039C61238